MKTTYTEKVSTIFVKEKSSLFFKEMKSSSYDLSVLRLKLSLCRRGSACIDWESNRNKPE